MRKRVTGSAYFYLSRILTRVLLKRPRVTELLIDITPLIVFFLFAKRIALPRFDTRSSHYRRWLPPDGCPIVAGKANNCRVES